MNVPIIDRVIWSALPLFGFFPLSGFPNAISSKTLLMHVLQQQVTAML